MEIAPVRVLSPVWARGRARVENEEIILDEARAEEYGFENPEASERMAFDLAVLSLHPGDEKEVVSFVGRYGLLWHGRMIWGAGSAGSRCKIGGQSLPGCTSWVCFMTP